jgi:hypothetical protein
MNDYRHAWTAMWDHPDAVALRAIGFIAKDRAELERFLSSSGLTSADLARHPIEPEHLTAVFDYLITHETVLMNFARTVDLPPELAYEARRVFAHMAPRTDMVAQTGAASGRH